MQALDVSWVFGLGVVGVMFYVAWCFQTGRKLI